MGNRILAKIMFSCFKRYRQGTLSEVVFWLWESRARFAFWPGGFTVNTMPPRIPVAWLPCEGSSTVWEDAWPLSETEGCGLMAPFWSFFAGAWVRRVVLKKDFAHCLSKTLHTVLTLLLWLAYDAPKTIYLVLAPHRLSLSVLCLRWAIFKVWCVPGTSIRGV